jgi:hypothetical protein
MSRDDERDRSERPRRSWREIDQLRNRSRHVDSGERRPRGEAAQARAGAATKQYVKGLDRLFSKTQGGADAERLAKTLRAAHGTPGFADACRSYRDVLGIPADPVLLQLFLDARDRALVLEALRALEAACEEGRLSPSSGLRSQLRLLSQEPDDEVAEAAEGLLARL